MKFWFGLGTGITLLVSGCLAFSASSALNYHQTKKIAVGGEGGWDYLTFDVPARRLFVTRGNQVMVVNTEKGTVSGEIANTPGVHGVALAPKLNRGFISDGGDNTVTVFDLKTLKEIERVPVGNRPDAILYDSASERVFTFNGGSHDSTAIDAATGKVAGTVPLDGRPEFGVSDEKGEIFVNIEDKSEIVAFDPRSLAVKNRWSLAPGEGPSGLSMDRVHRRLFSVCDNQKMVVMDADSGKIVATPAIGNGPDASAFDPKLGMAFSSNGQDGTLTLIHEDSPDHFTVSSTVPTARGARTMALDPKSHTVYLATASFAPTPAGTGSDGPRRRPAMEPGSFVILAYGK